MTPSLNDAGFVRMPNDEFEAMLARAAEQGARRALADVGLEGPNRRAVGSGLPAPPWAPASFAPGPRHNPADVDQDS